MSRPTLRAGRGLLAALALAACSTNPDPLRPLPATDVRTISLCAAGASCADTLDLRFLGVTGFTFAEPGRAAVVATGPFFTRASGLRAFLPFSVSADTAVIARAMARYPMDSVRALLVGHAHYDHLMDVPFVARRFAPLATVMGSSTMAFQLASDSVLMAQGRVASVADSMGSRERPGRWIYLADRRWRVMPIRSSHARHFWFYRFSPGGRDKPMSRTPRTARAWKQGVALAWLIDLLDESGRTRFRILYHDSANEPEYSARLPVGDGDTHGVDLAIISVGGWYKAQDYPRTLIDSLAPRHVIAGHWEDFFAYTDGAPRSLPLGKVKELAALLDTHQGIGRWTTPSPGTTLRIAY